MSSRLFSAATRLGVGVTALGCIPYCIYDVDGGERAVIFHRINGIQHNVIGEGTHFKIPYIQVPVIFDIRAKVGEIKTATGTKDLQRVTIALRVLCRPEENSLAWIYQKLGKDFKKTVLPSIGNEVLKAVVAQYNAEELLSKRSLISGQIGYELKKRAEQFHLILDDVSITELEFGVEFSKAIENKQVAQQEAETQFWLVAKAEQDKKASVIRAEGEAEAAELISKAMSVAGTGLIEVRRIDTAKDVAATLARGRNVTYLPSTTGSGSNILLGIGNQG